MSKVVSTRVTDSQHTAIQARLAGRNRSAWLLGLIEAELAAPLDIALRAVEPEDVGWCDHPEVRVVGGYCVACGSTVAT